MNSLGSTSSGNGFVKTFEAAEIQGNAKTLNANKPFLSVLFPSNSSHLVNHPVFMILFTGGRAKVVPSIVLAILIAVINLSLRVFTRHVEVRESMSRPFDLVNLDQPVAVRREVPGDVSSRGPGSADAHAPVENSGLRVIGKNFAQALRGKIGGSHEALLLLIGQRPAGVSSTARASSFYWMPG